MSLFYLNYFDSVIELFDKVLERLEEDYNVKEYPGNLVEQVNKCENSRKLGSI